ncbi:hypothetical protein OAL71_01810 [Phycisphaerales bacterium]|nr:hypothetical protein [Phycisphaerales bacterium]
MVAPEAEFTIGELGSPCSVVEEGAGSVDAGGDETESSQPEIIVNSPSVMGVMVDRNEIKGRSPSKCG